MADRRIRISSSQVDLVKKLLRSEDSTGSFRLQVDVLAFAASVGARKQRRRKFSDPAKEPIRYAVFESQNYVPLMNLLAVCAENDPRVLADTDQMEDARATIFEEFASGGLEIIDQELQGAVDYQAALLMMIASQRSDDVPPKAGDFDLSKFLD